MSSLLLVRPRVPSEFWILNVTHQLAPMRRRDLGRYQRLVLAVLSHLAASYSALPAGARAEDRPESVEIFAI